MDNALNKVVEATITFTMDEEVAILDHSEYSLTQASTRHDRQKGRNGTAIAFGPH